MQQLTKWIGIGVFAYTLFAIQPLNAKGKKEKEKEGFIFKTQTEIPTTPVKDQASSGTCWSFATTSFIETELIRLGKGEHDLAEMYFVRHAYEQKAQKYLRYQGLANFSQGGQGHDVTNVIHEFGMVPESVYSGLNYGFDYHQHTELERVMKGVLDNSLRSKRTFTGRSLDVISATLDIYLGEVPEKFTYNGEEYTPMSFAKSMEIDPEDYVELTSYAIYPYYKAIDLEVPDNWSHDNYYNLPVDELMEVMKYAFENGYSVDWDGDVSEQGFSHSKGVAVLPEDEPQNMDANERLKWESLPEDERDDLLYKLDGPVQEKHVTQEMRQLTFDKYKTTDDHLMHLVGTAVDQSGTLYFKTKNSWAADSNKKGGYLYMSEPFIRLKTVAIMVHKDAIPEGIKEKLGL